MAGETGFRANPAQAGFEKRLKCHGFSRGYLQGESNEAFLSKMASRLNGTLFIQDDYWPVAVFYSGRKTIRIVEPDKKYYSIKAVFENSERPFQILAKRNDFNDMDKYKVIVQKEDRVLVGVE